MTEPSTEPTGHTESAVADRVNDLRAMPVGSELWRGFDGYRKRERGDWIEIKSGPLVFTSHDLVLMGLP